FEVDLLDLCFCPNTEDFTREIEGYFASKSPFAVAITLRNTDDTSLVTRDFFIPRLKEIIDCVRAHTSAHIILGGSGFSIMPEAILQYCGLDLGIWGEGEYSLPLLLEKMVGGEDYHGVPGLVFRVTEGFHLNAPKYIDLKSMPAPERNAVDNRRYFLEGGMGSIEAKRGCPGRCIYCADPLTKGRRVRRRSPRSVVDEIEALLQKGIDHFHFCDSEFNLPPAHAGEICREIVSRGLSSRVRWYAYCSPAPFSEGLATLFRKAGCAGINFGVDSANERMLRTLGRDFTVEDVARTAQLCHQQGIVFMYDLLLGGPGETRDSLGDTIEKMKWLSPFRVGASLGVRIFPGTRLAAMVRRQGPVEQNPNLRGVRDEKFFTPVFYLSSALGEDALGYLAGLVAGDERFFFMSGEVADQNYNYNENDLLTNAIRDGYRGAFWDILRRLGG
ncbi:MAG: radical SAM protein, partial [Dehalococcoidia bacterium]|nr:radical SAM protein [Dehalococcoidia bacterium]